MDEKDTLYASLGENFPSNGSFAFDEPVTKVFADMINRSVPGYESVLSMIGMLCRRYSIPDTNLYDLGSSLGASTLALRRNAAQGCIIIGVDNSKPMIDRCEKNISFDRSVAPVRLICSDICSINFQNASVIVSNYTIQFVSPEQRVPLLKKIYSSLIPGGIFILSEKISFAVEDEQKLMTGLHHDFKRLRGYSDLEIAAKRQALENVLVPDTSETILSHLKQAGFQAAYQWYRWFNFGSFLGIKSSV